jgi:DNA mismatch repair protein MutS2
MALSIGAAVTVRTFGSKRGVVIAVSGDGRYQVRIEAVTMWCSEEDLSVPQEPRKKKGGDGTRRDGPRRHGATEKDSGPVAPPGHIDLHGLVVEEALERVVDEIDRSLLRGADRVEVVHGKGSGRIRDALHRHLASMPGLTFQLDPRNPGVTWVHFR